MKHLLLIFALSIIHFLSSAQSSSYSTGAFNEGYEEGLILIALDDLKFLEKSQKKQAQSEKSFKQKLKGKMFDTQINIALKAAKLNTVILLLKNREDLNIFNKYVRTHFRLYTKIKNNQILTEVVDHDAVWIRDYGPSFILNNDQTITILNANYHDSRLDFEIAKKIARINKKRIEKAEELLFTIELQIYLEDIVKMIGDNISKEEKKEILAEKKELFNDQYEKVNNYLNAYNTIHKVYSGEYRVRNADDKLPVAVAEKIYNVTHFSIDSTQINLDGGNILRNPACDCFLSSDVISKNEYNREATTKILKNSYLCKRVIYLNPLPGQNIIKHVDMFLLPVDSNTVLLASFNPDYPVLRKEWTGKHVDKDLAIEAEIAMRQNYKILKQNGFNVIWVPSYLPRYSITEKKQTNKDISTKVESALTESQILYYPTLLNVLIQRSSKEQKQMQLLVPSYNKLDQTIFSNAMQIIQNRFSESYSQYFSVKTDYIDCSSAAKMQGAIHCLTLSIPGNFTKFTNSFYQNNLIKIKSKLDKLGQQN